MNLKKLAGMLPEMEDAMKSEELGLSSFQGLDLTRVITGTTPEVPLSDPR